MTPEELEKLLREQHIEFLNNGSPKTKVEPIKSIEDMPNNNNAKVNEPEFVIKPDYVRKDITPTSPIGYNSEMFLDSTIFSGTGATNAYVYESINDYGSRWPPGYTGYHFEVDSKWYSLSSDSKSCTFKLIGHPQNSGGYSKLVQLTATDTFTLK